MEGEWKLTSIGIFRDGAGDDDRGRVHGRDAAGVKARVVPPQVCRAAVRTNVEVKLEGVDGSEAGGDEEGRELHVGGILRR